jgi:hypothetical protein
MSSATVWSDLRNDDAVPKPLTEFLISLYEMGDHKLAAETTRGFTWGEHYKALDSGEGSNPAYKRWYDLVLRTMEEAASDEAYRRAVYGVEEEVIYRGEKTGVTHTSFSDTLLKDVITKGRTSRYAGQPADDGQKRIEGIGTILVLPDNSRDRPSIVDLGPQRDKSLSRLDQ